MRYNISIRDSRGKLIRGVSQWDVNRVIRIRGAIGSVRAYYSRLQRRIRNIHCVGVCY